ncbi:MAG: hypothetical protein GY856_24780 [bacterium]|nr:hypothetical protein [bacterium]
MKIRRFSLTMALCVAIVTIVGLSAQSSAEENKEKKYHPRTYSKAEVVALKERLRSMTPPTRPANLPHDSNPLKGKLEPKAGKAPDATAVLIYDDGTPARIGVFTGTAPTYFVGNTFTNPGTGAFSVVLVTPYLHPPWPWGFCSPAHNHGDGVVTVAVVSPGSATTVGFGTAAIPTFGFVPVPLASATPVLQSFVAGHIIDATDCAGTPGSTNHWAEGYFYDSSATGGGTPGAGNAFVPGAFTSPWRVPSTIFTRATIVGPNVPVELTHFSVE